MLASTLLPGFGRMTSSRATGGVHSRCSWIGGQAPCHKLDAPLGILHLDFDAAENRVMENQLEVELHLLPIEDQAP